MAYDAWQDVENAFGAAVRGGNARQVLSCWTAAKRFPDALELPLASVVEAMQRFKKDSDHIVRRCDALLKSW